MSDLFKRHRPRLSEDEERALWERVRTIPREAGGRRPAGERKRSPWEVLWARPAVRYGAPALAVALVAVVWVAQKEPVAPARRNAELRTGPAEERAQVESQDAPDVLAPAPQVTALPPSASTVPAAPVRDRAGAEQEGDANTRMLKAAGPANERLAQREAGAGDVVRGAREAELRSEEGGAGATSGSAKLDYVVPPPAAAPPSDVRGEGASAPAAPAVRKERQVIQAEPQGVKDFYRENPKVGTIRAVDEAKADAGRVAELRAARGSRTSAALLGDRILVEVLVPSGSGTFLETVSLPLSGGVARIAVGNTPGSLWVEAGSVRDLIRIAGRETGGEGPTQRRVELDPGAQGAGAAAIVSPRGRALSSRFVLEGGDERALAGPRTTARSRAAALAAELILAVASGDPRSVARVRDAAHRLAEERPNDAAARALAAWSDDARTAFAAR